MEAKMFQVWAEWNRMTRFFQSSLIALQREGHVWNSGYIHASSAVTVQDPSGSTKYKVKLADHLASISDVQMLCMLVLTRSVALLEGHVVDVLEHLYPTGVVPGTLLPAGLGKDDVHDAAVQLLARGGIESWGSAVLALVGGSWSNVHDGRRGLVEVAVIRNSIAHGQSLVNQRMANRVAAVGGALPWAVGSPIVLDLEDTRRLRDRVRSFIRIVAYGSAKLLP